MPEPRRRLRESDYWLPAHCGIAAYVSVWDNRMRIEIDVEDCQEIWMDRGCAEQVGNRLRRRFEILLGQFQISFQDEDDALRLATKIVERMGLEIKRPLAPCP